MTLATPSAARPLVTLVLRVWLQHPAPDLPELRVEATRVQTGDVAYFRTIEGVAHHIERLIHVEANAPIDFSTASGRTKKHE
jgi:hypothetical protein